ncbi:uncharacterized protein M6B38_207880 [Iris pallida]|uniref:S-adenosyl-L-methionine-dependent methyltransferase n=1 Tax=Iris pallida TaxID=29817 RepID=A0AAX6E622_IRIPA|nr:uncharacterized protein M6B38_207880 [Iris pallida]
MKTLISLPPLFPSKALRKPAKISARARSSDDGIPADEVRVLAKFKSRHNDIRVLEVSRRADHPFAGSRLLLLDAPGNIHSISFLLRTLTSTYFDVFASLPPLLPPGPVGVLGFGAGSAARLLLHLYPHREVHGWELDPSVISVAGEYFGLKKLQKQHPRKLFVYVGDALEEADVEGGFAGVLVDLFMKGRVVRELQEEEGWERVRRTLRRGGRVMVNCGGRCVEAEDGGDGGAVMEETLAAMGRVFGADKVFVLRLGGGDGVVAMTGEEPDFRAWKEGLVEGLRGYVDMWVPLGSWKS